MLLKRATVVAVALILSPQIKADSSSDVHSPRLEGTIFQIGGGQLSDPPTRVIAVRDQTLGISWDNDVSCGKFDPKITISNQLNGITDGFKDMMGNIIQSATGAVASLPGLALQKATPELYDMLQQGVLQGKMDFEWAETSCEEMQKVIMGEQGFPFENLKVSASYEAWAGEIADSDGDAVKAKKEVAETSVGDNGIDWVCGERRGGATQEPLEPVTDVVIAGYNILFDRTNSCDRSGISGALGDEAALARYWSSPLLASQWVADVVGDIQIRTCDCPGKMTGRPGKGLMYKYMENAELVANRLIDLVDGNTPLTHSALTRVSAPPGVMVKANVILSIQQKDAINRQKLINQIASEIAYVRMVEQTKLATRMLMTGLKEPNIAAQHEAKEVIDNAINDLQIEMDQLETETRKRKEVASGTLQQLMLLEEKAVLESRRAKSGNKSRTNVLGEIQ